MERVVENIRNYKTGAQRNCTCNFKRNSDEKRPICLATDVSARLSGLVQADFSSALEKANVLEDYIKAYRAGISVDDCTHELLCAIEDIQQFWKSSSAAMAIIDDDFTKFFDTLSGLLQAHCLRQIGCPHQGYIQWLFEDLGPNSVLIKTVDRDIWSSFLNGIKQGKGFSCPVAIVIGAFIIRIWRKSRRATATTAPIEDGAQQYTFHAAHHLDHNPPALDAISYSDDQSRILGFQYDGPQSLPRIRSTSQGFLDAMGAFTIVTKTARQSLKSSIRLLGIPPGDAANFPPFKSWAFHYLQERPILSDIATIVQTTYAPLPPPPAEHTDAPDQVFWRHFGTKMNMQGKVATDAIVPSILQRAKKCFQRGRSREAMAKLYNSLVASLNEFNVLARLIPVVQLSQQVDMVIAKKYAHLFGITQNDPKHRLYLWQQHHGHNLRSMATAMLQSTARELLVRLTHVGLRTPAMMRSRVAAIDLDPDARNYIYAAIKELATYGIFLRLQLKLPNILSSFRDFIAATLITGNISNIFQNSTLPTLLLPAEAAQRPQPELTIQSVLTYKHILEKSEYSLCLFCNKEIASRLYCLCKEINIRISIKSKI